MADDERPASAEALAGMMTSTELARELGVDRTTVSKIAHRLKVGWKPAGTRGVLLLTRAEADQIRALQPRPRRRTSRKEE